MPQQWGPRRRPQAFSAVSAVQIFSRQLIIYVCHAPNAFRKPALGGKPMISKVMSGGDGPRRSLKRVTTVRYPQRPSQLNARRAQLAGGILPYCTTSSDYLTQVPVPSDRTVALVPYLRQVRYRTSSLLGGYGTYSYEYEQGDPLVRERITGMDTSFRTSLVAKYGTVRVRINRAYFRP